MATSRITSMLALYFLLLLSLSLTTSLVEAGRTNAGLNGFVDDVGVPVSCQSVVGVRTGDTCFAVSRRFNLTDAGFAMINPNLDCDKLFPGQWLCVRGAV